MTKIILIQPHYPSSPLGSGHLPVGLGYLAERLYAAGIDYEISDLGLEGAEDLYEKIGKFNPEYIGISLMSLDIQCSYNLVATLKKDFPAVKIIAGGPHISFMKERAMEECTVIDYAIAHEGEEALIELLNGNPVDKIRGLLYRDQVVGVVYNGDRPFLADLDMLPFPTYRRFDIERYGSCISIASSRGCPFSCIFCGAFLSMGRKWRARSAAKVIEEIAFWYDKGYRDFNFVDSNFFFSQQRIIELCRTLGRQDLTISISSDGIRGKDVDFEMLREIRRFGLKRVAIGIESANEDILKIIKKGESLEEIKKGLHMLYELHISVVAFFILGLPGEGVMHVLRSFIFVLKYPNIEQAFFFNPNPLYGTELYNIAKEQNYLRGSDSQIFENIGGMSEQILVETPELSILKRKILLKIASLVSSVVRKKYKLYRVLGLVGG